jgi:hypothetical protein
MSKKAFYDFVSNCLGFLWYDIKLPFYLSFFLSFLSFYPVITWSSLYSSKRLLWIWKLTEQIGFALFIDLLFLHNFISPVANLVPA